MKHLTGLALVLVVFWLANSGHFDPLLLGLGVVSVAGVLYMTRRLEKVDNEYEPPILLTPRLPGYLGWLLLQIIKSNIEVVRCIWQSPPRISPSLIRVTASQKDDVYQVLYANSITMTPGTVTLEMNDNELLVHALTQHAAAELRGGEMDRRVKQVEG